MVVRLGQSSSIGYKPWPAPDVVMVSKAKLKEEKSVAVSEGEGKEGMGAF